jgi:hypothetical protein
VTSFRNVLDDKVQFHVSPFADCPCGSGFSANGCCLTQTGFRKVPATVLPPSPTTGLGCRGCYADRLSDCGPKLSREHYISESLLHVLNTNAGLRVSGLNWQDGQEMTLPPSALAARILCDRHNSALSPLDAIAVRLFHAFTEVAVAGSGRRELILFCGHDIERWLLKTLCGLAYSGNLGVDSGIDISIPDWWLAILFGQANFADGQGLYVCNEKGHKFEGPRGVMLRSIVGKRRITGLSMYVCGYELILSMSGFASRHFDGRTVVYRPLELHATAHEFEKSVVFSWSGVADLGTISLEVVGA